MNKTISTWIGIVLKTIVFALLLTIVFGYLFGFRAALVVGYSSEPNIHYHSLAIDYKCPYEDLKVGDYVTFKTGAYTTHIIVAIAGRGDFESYGDTFKKGDKIQFVNRGVKFERTITQDCQIVTMATNFADYDKYTEATKENPNFMVGDGNGTMIECFNYTNVVGRVEHSLTNTGKFIFFVRNNFLQIIVYVIILYAGSLFLKTEDDYSRLF